MPQNPPRPESVACRACGSGNVSLLHDIVKPPSRRGEFLVCQQCGVISFFAKSPDLAYEQDYYGRGEAKFHGLAGFLRRWSLTTRAKRAHRTAGKTGTCLDIGCGDGDFLLGMQRLGWDVRGSELPGPACRRSAARLPGKIYEGQNYDSAVTPLSCDLVSLWQVFEHLPDPIAILAKIRPLLKDDGWLLIAVPNPCSWQALWGGGDWLHADPPRHLHLASPAQLASLLNANGFSVRATHHPWLEFGVIGFIQTLFNRVGLPRDEFFENLRGGWQQISSPKKLGYLAAVALLLPAAFTLAFVESCLGRSSTYEVWARKKL